MESYGEIYGFMLDTGIGRGYNVRMITLALLMLAVPQYTDPLKFDAEKVARIHNGGPKGYRKKATIKYWKKVLTELNR
mgnify:CR=1 FL=1